MKSTKDFRSDKNTDVVRKAVKLEPIRKSGKEKHEIFKNLNGKDEDEDEYLSLHKRESVLDYIGDEEEDDDLDEEFDDEDLDDEEDEDLDDEFDDDEDFEEED